MELLIRFACSMAGRFALLFIAAGIVVVFASAPLSANPQCDEAEVADVKDALDTIVKHDEKFIKDLEAGNKDAEYGMDMGVAYEMVSSAARKIEAMPKECRTQFDTYMTRLSDNNDKKITLLKKVAPERFVTPQAPSGPVPEQCAGPVGIMERLVSEYIEEDSAVIELMEKRLMEKKGDSFYSKAIDSTKMTKVSFMNLTLGAMPIECKLYAVKSIERMNNHSEQTRERSKKLSPVCN